MQKDDIGKAASLMGKKGGRAKWDNMTARQMKQEKKRLREIGKLGGWPKGKSRKKEGE